VTFQSLEVCECDHALSIPLGLAPRKGLGAGAMRLGHGSYVFFSLLRPLLFCYEGFLEGERHDRHL
jgi:hypothetical protein